MGEDWNAALWSPSSWPATRRAGRRPSVISLSDRCCDGWAALWAPHSTNSINNPYLSISLATAFISFSCCLFFVVLQVLHAVWAMDQMMNEWVTHAQVWVLYLDWLGPRSKNDWFNSNHKVTKIPPCSRNKEDYKRETPMYIENEKIQQLKEYKYLGSSKIQDGTTKGKIRSRLIQAKI